MTAQAFAEDCIRNGGFTSLALSGSLKAEDLPPETPAHIRAFVRQVAAVAPSVEVVDEYVNGIASDMFDQAMDRVH
jgi:hypothetical protein